MSDVTVYAVLQAAQRPLGVTSEVRVGVGAEVAEQGQETRVAAVAHGDDGVAAQAGALGALDG